MEQVDSEFIITFLALFWKLILRVIGNASTVYNVACASSKDSQLASLYILWPHVWLCSPAVAGLQLEAALMEQYGLLSHPFWWLFWWVVSYAQEHDKTDVIADQYIFSSGWVKKCVSTKKTENGKRRRKTKYCLIFVRCFGFSVYTVKHTFFLQTTIQSAHNFVAIARIDMGVWIAYCKQQHCFLFMALYYL